MTAFAIKAEAGFFSMGNTLSEINRIRRNYTAALPDA